MICHALIQFIHTTETSNTTECHTPREAALVPRPHPSPHRRAHARPSHARPTPPATTPPSHIPRAARSTSHAPVSRTHASLGASRPSVLRTYTLDSAPLTSAPCSVCFLNEVLGALAERRFFAAWPQRWLVTVGAALLAARLCCWRVARRIQSRTKGARQRAVLPEPRTGLCRSKRDAWVATRRALFRRVDIKWPAGVAHASHSTTRARDAGAVVQAAVHATA